MLAEIDTSVYDVSGRSVGGIRTRHKLARPQVPFGRFFSRELSHQCNSLDEIRVFLRGCRYVSDQRQFGTDDYWVPPDEFEVSKQGDCEDFALWTWRQLIAIGYECRFVGGSAGFYGAGHAWLTFVIDGRHYLLEPLARRSKKIPRLSVSAYHPVFSVVWDGARAHFYEHKPTRPHSRLSTYVRLVPEWALFHLAGCGRTLIAFAALPALMVRHLWRRARR